MLLSSGQGASQIGRDRTLAFLRNGAGNQDLFSAAGFAEVAATEPPGNGISRPPGSPLRQSTPSRLLGSIETGRDGNCSRTSSGSGRLDTRRTCPAPLALRDLEQFGRDRRTWIPSETFLVPARSASDLCNASNIWLMFGSDSRFRYRVSERVIIRCLITRFSLSQPASSSFPHLLALQVGI